MSYKDFLTVLREDVDPRSIMNDWYKIHVRLGSSIGARMDEDGNPRFTYSDEPTMNRRGRCLRIRTPQEDIAEHLQQIGAIELAQAQADIGDVSQFSIILSARTDNPDLAPSTKADAEIFLKSRLETAGLSMVGPTQSLHYAVYTIRKPRIKTFRIRGIHAHFSARITDQDRFQTAMTTGIGRDKGLGFGVLATKSSIV